MTCVDDPPVAEPDTASTAEDTVVAIAVLTNDTDVDGGPKQVESVTDPAHGSAKVSAGGSAISYAPAQDYCGPDSFAYSLNGGSTATVSVEVTCVDDPPVGVPDTASTVEDTVVAIAVLGNDTDVDGGPKLVESATAPLHGSATVSTGGSAITCTPAPDTAAHTPSATRSTAVRRRRSRSK